MIFVLFAPLLPLALYAVALCVAYAWRRARYKEGPHPGVLRLVRLIGGEAFAQWRMLGWALLLRGDRLPARDGVPVLLVHGFSTNGYSMWRLRRAFHIAGRATLAPSLGLPGRSLSAYAQPIIAAMERAERVDVVCHSLGGVAFAVALSERPDLAERVRSVVLIASPLAGTRSLWRRVPLPEVRALLTGATLPNLGALLPHASIATVAMPYDVMIYPIASTQLAGAEHHVIEVGHADLVVDRRAVALVLGLVVSLTREPTPAPRR